MQRPGHIGGTLIRRVKKFFNQYPSEDSYTLACSGGPDSIALTHLFVKYGYKICEKDRIRVLHVNHGLRDSSNKDADFVREYCKRQGILCHVHTLDIDIPKGASLEDVARKERHDIFQFYKRVVTAHTLDDVAETLLWRFFTGAPKSLTNCGILPQYKNQYRPFLTTKKEEILKFLDEENLDHCIDETNYEGKFLRSKIRVKLEPVLNEVFPGWKKTITKSMGALDGRTP